MKTHEFLSLLDAQGDNTLLFEYAPGKIVPNDYHITEISNVTLDSVDCGGNPHYERRTVVQLWAPELEPDKVPLTAAKARKIFDIVDKVKPMEGEAEIWFEYGNFSFHTAQFRVAAVENGGDTVSLKLTVPATACKPRVARELAGLGGQKGCC
ncbi:MAG: DUF6428 family protein [Bacteroidota bacterium]